MLPLHEQLQYEQKANFMVDAPVTLIGSMIDKARLTQKYALPRNPYELALHFCLERLHLFLKTKEQAGKRIHMHGSSGGSQSTTATRALRCELSSGGDIG